MYKLNLTFLLLIVIEVNAYYDIEKHPSFKLLPIETCGDNSENRIIGGMVASLGQFPWMAAIGFATKGCEDILNFRCGGSLITIKHVITAAHCITNLPQGKCPQESDLSEIFPHIVRLGEHNIDTNPDCEDDGCAATIQDIKIHKIIPYKSYNNPKLRHDIGMIILKRPARLNQWVNTICLIHGSNLFKSYVNSTGIVAGWGIINVRTKQTSNVLQYLKVKVVSSEKCFPEYKRLVTLFEDSQICAGGVLNQDSCSGDSGGALTTIIDTEEGPRNALLGVLSFGYKVCAGRPIPAIYTNVRYYGKWILDNL